jgi:hypothetical protein
MKEQQQRFVVARPGKYKIMDGTDISAREAATSFFFLSRLHVCRLLFRVTNKSFSSSQLLLRMRSMRFREDVNGHHRRLE